MSHFSNKVFTGSFGGTGAIANTLNDCTFSVTASGTVTFTLTHNANNSVTGSANVTSGTFQSTPTGGFNCIATSGSFGGSGSVAGTFPNISATVSGFTSTTFNGSFNNTASAITGTAAITFTNTTGQITSDITATASLTPVISIAISTRVDEGDDTFVVLTRSFATDVTSTVTVSSSSTLSATAGPEGSPDLDRTAVDFWAIEGTITFEPGQTTQTIPIHTVDNKIAEANELITIRLSNPVNASIGIAQGTVTIVDDDSFFGVPFGALVGDGSSETLDGTTDPDFIHGRGGNDTINGSGGNDTLKGGRGADDINGGDDDDKLKGGKGADVLNGGAGNDTLTGGPGRDTLDGGEGSDTYKVSANENKVDTYQDSGSSGIDTLDASKLNLIMMTNGFNLGGAGIEVINGAADGTVLTGNGSAGLNWDFTDIELTNITLKGTLEADRITGSTGNDVIKGGKGKDELSGSDGNDVLKGGQGADVLNGGDDNDVLKGGKGADVLNGGAGDDTLKGGPGRDTLDGGEGSDTYVVSASENKVDTYQDSGSSGVDTLDASQLNLIMLTNGFSHGGAGIEVINGAADGTVLTGNGSAGLNWDFTDIELNNIDLKGTLLADRITGSTGNDVIKGSLGKDTLSGGEGDDTLKGGRGADSISGNDGDDFLKGGRGKDTLVGGDGDDTLKGGLGTDTLTGDAGADIFIIKGVDTVNDFDHAEGDELQLNGGIGPNLFQWGFQSPGATRANTFGAITSDFLLEATNKGALLGAVASAASSLFGNTIASGVSSVGYFFGLTDANNGLFYIIANQHTEAASVTTTFSTVTVAILEGITGLGTGINQIAQSDIILF